MDKATVEEKVYSVIRPRHVDYISVWSGGPTIIDVHLEGSSDVSLKDLEKLSEAFGTRDINFCYVEEEVGHSEFTPGDDSEVYLRITLKGDSNA